MIRLKLLIQIFLNQYAGFYSGDDAWCPGYQGLDFGMWFIADGVVTFTKQEDFSGDRIDGSGDSGYDINPQTGQLMRCSFTWHGFLDLEAEVRTDQRKWVGYETKVFVNSAVRPHLGNPNLPISARVERLSGSGDPVVLKCGSWRGGVIAGIENNNRADRWFPAFVVDRAHNNGVTHLVTLRSKDLFKGKTNYIRAIIRVLNSSNSTAKEVVFKACRLSALSAGNQATIEAGFSDINTSNSVIESSRVDFQLASSISDDDTIDLAVVFRNSQYSAVEIEGFEVLAGDDVVFVAEGAGNGEISFQINFKELH